MRGHLRMMLDTTDLIMIYAPADEPFEESAMRLNTAIDEDSLVVGKDATDTARAIYAYRHHHYLWVRRWENVDEWWKRTDYTEMRARWKRGSDEYWQEMEERVRARLKRDGFEEA